MFHTILTVSSDYCSKQH